MISALRALCAIGAVATVITALRVAPALLQVGAPETVLVTLCVARMAVSMLAYAATGRTRA